MSADGSGPPPPPAAAGRATPVHAQAGAGQAQAAVGGPAGTPAGPGRPAAGAAPAAPADPDDPRGVSTAGRDAASAAATPNRTQVSQDLRQMASAQFGTANVTGNIVAGDYTVYAGSGPGRMLSMRLLTAETLSLVENAFVRPDNYADLRAVMLGSSLLVLRGADGSGKNATAIHLLQAVNATRINQLDPDTDVDQLCDQIEAGHGYLLSDLHHGNPLRGTVLDDLNTRLRQHNAWLILTVPAGISVPDPAVLPYVHDLGRSATPAAVARQHLIWRMRDRVTVDALLARSDVADLVRDLLPAGAAIRLAAHFAKVFVSECAGDRVDVAAVRTRMSQHSDDDLAGWFDGLPGTSTQCFAVALAVLNNLPFETVAEQSRKLEALVDPPQVTALGVPVARPTVFQASRSSRMRHLRARVRNEVIPSFQGPTPADIVGYIDEAYPRAILLRVWDEYDAIQPHLLEWLKGLGNHPSEAVRVWGAAAVGELTRHSFDYLIRGVIRPWARSKDWRSREAAAFALAVPFAEQRLADQVTELVRSWSWERENLQLQATAASAYGLTLAAADPDGALTALETLAARDDAHIALAIGYGVAGLVTSEPDMLLPVLRKLRLWTTDRQQRKRHLTGQVVFLVLAGDLLTDADPVGPDDTAIRWPALLAAARREPDVAQLVCALWRDVLNGADLHMDARSVLAAWAHTVEPDSRARIALAWLCTGIAEPSPRTVKILDAQTKEWMSGDNPIPAPRTAVSVKAAMASITVSYT